MDYYSLSDKAIATELGQRIKARRLRRNLTQQELASACTLSLNSIKALEGGKGKLATLIAVLRELQSLDDLASLVPEIGVSPLQMARLKGKQRLRASGQRSTGVDTDSAGSASGSTASEDEEQW